MTLHTKTLVALLATTALGFATTANAQDGWSGEASVAGSKTTGNTETTDLGIALNVQKESDLWRHTVRGSADFARVSGVNNKERFTLGYQLDRDITDRLYVFGTAIGSKMTLVLSKTAIISVPVLAINWCFLRL